MRTRRTIRLSAPKPCLLSLPAEIRTYIWSLLLVSPNVLVPRVRNIFNAVESQELSKVPFLDLPAERTLAIARTNAQLHNEIIAVYFGYNRFSFSNTWEMYAFLYMIGDARRICIRDITFMCNGSQRREAFEMLAGCKSLRHLKVLVCRNTTKGARKPQNDLLRAEGMRVFRAIRGLRGCSVVVKENVEVIEQTGPRCGYRTSFRDLQDGEKSWFNNAHINMVERLLGDEITREEEDITEVQVKE